MNTKTCSQCGNVKSIEDFRQRKYKNGKLYRLKQCKDCEREKMRLYSREKFGYNPKGTPKQKFKIVKGKTRIQCRICNNYKALNDFTIDSRNKHFGRTTVCKSCRKKLRRERYESITDSKAMIHRIYLNSKHRATLHGIEFTITEKDIILPDKCPYLNIKLEYKSDRNSSPSIDRINNTKGYTPDNIEVISTLANRVKHVLSIDELLLFSQNAINIHSK